MEELLSDNSWYGKNGRSIVLIVSQTTTQSGHSRFVANGTIKSIFAG
jgi:hypothetical protein|tara:strand:- start:156 stop:296 length:141 start_codon:yes stop_codon:yes gene_type:complete